MMRWHLNPNASTITLNINELNASIKSKYCQQGVKNKKTKLYDAVKGFSWNIRIRNVKSNKMD